MHAQVDYIEDARKQLWRGCLDAHDVQLHVLGFDGPTVLAALHRYLQNAIHRGDILSLVKAMSAVSVLQPRLLSKPTQCTWTAGMPLCTAQQTHCRQTPRKSRIQVLCLAFEHDGAFFSGAAPARSHVLNT